ncbi:MAG: DUF4286 family protein [Bacteroidota bacterium]
MIVYNVTFSVDKGISDEWISWMKETHIPKLLKEGMFESCKMLKVLSHDDEQTDAFAVQFFSKLVNGAEKYHLNDDIQKRFGDRVLSYSTLLREV